MTSDVLPITETEWLRLLNDLHTHCIDRTQPVPFLKNVIIDAKALSYIYQPDNLSRQINLKWVSFENCKIQLLGNDLSLNLDSCSFKNCILTLQLNIKNSSFVSCDCFLREDSIITNCQFIKGTYQWHNSEVEPDVQVNTYYSCFEDTAIYPNNLKFIGCTYTLVKLYSAYLKQISNAAFIDCIIEGMFINSEERKKTFSDSLFVNSTLVTSFIDISIDKSVLFEGCDLNRCNFYGAEIDIELLKLLIRQGVSTIATKIVGYTLKGRDDNYESVKDFDFSQCNLSGAILKNLDLSNLSFRNANLKGVRFENCVLFHTDFRGTNLKDSVFENVKSAEAHFFAGTDLLGAKLPENLGDFDRPLKLTEEAAKNARTLFVTLIPLCFYIFLLYYFNQSEHLKLPFVDIQLDPDGFLLGGIIAITGVYVTLHIYLAKMFDQLAYLPACFPDGAPLADRIYPWLLSTVAWAGDISKKKLRMRENMQIGVALLSAWLMPLFLVESLIVKSICNSVLFKPSPYLITLEITCLILMGVFANISRLCVQNIHK